MKNYIVINGKKAELTKEQLEKLGIERNNPFDRVARGMTYFVPIFDGTTKYFAELNDCVDKDYYDSTDYFNDEEFAEQMSLKWLLSRKLEKYAWDNNAEDVEWDRHNSHFCIHYFISRQHFVVGEYGDGKITGIVYFSDRDVAEDAIKDVIEPFMKEHPNFKW